MKIYHEQTEGNEHKRGSCLVEFAPALAEDGHRPGSGSVYYVRKAGLELRMMYLSATIKGGVNRWCILASRKAVRECRGFREAAGMGSAITIK